MRTHCPELLKLYDLYNRAFGSSSADGVLAMAEVFDETVTGAQMREESVAWLRDRFYAELRARFAEWKRLQLVSSAKLFGSKAGKDKIPELPPLVATPSPGDKIVLDDEELSAIASEPRGGARDPIESPFEAVEAVERAFRSIEAEGRIFPDSINSSREDFAIAMGLVKLLSLARSRLDARDFAGAAQTCVKVIGLAGTTNTPNFFAVQDAWLLLAEIHAGYGDLPRSRSLLEQANRTAREEMVRQNPDSRWYRRDWESRAAKVKKLID